MSALDIAGVRAIEEMSLNALPTLATVTRDGWVARFAQGVTGRANSVNALQPGATPVADIAAAMELLYANARLPCRFRVTPLCPPETESVLLGRGYALGERTATEVAAIPSDVVVDATVRVTPVADRAWRDAYGIAAGRFNAAQLDVLARIHAAIVPPAAFARIEIGGVILALGYAVAERGFVSLHEIATMPEARKRGLARRLVTSLLAWGRSQGARESWLQVVTTNTPARALYRSLGFRPAYEYVYVTRERGA
jgi:ribosomal protein S18 acetylase RimI-like enzyme